MWFHFSLSPVSFESGSLTPSMTNGVFIYLMIQACVHGVSKDSSFCSWPTSNWLSILPQRISHAFYFLYFRKARISQLLWPFLILILSNKLFLPLPPWKNANVSIFSQLLITVNTLCCLKDDVEWPYIVQHH